MKTVDSIQRSALGQLRCVFLLRRLRTGLTFFHFNQLLLKRTLAFLFILLFLSQCGEAECVFTACVFVCLAHVCISPTACSACVCVCVYTCTEMFLPCICSRAAVLSVHCCRSCVYISTCPYACVCVCVCVFVFSQRKPVEGKLAVEEN